MWRDTFVCALQFDTSALHVACDDDIINQCFNNVCVQRECGIAEIGCPCLASLANGCGPGLTCANVGKGPYICVEVPQAPTDPPIGTPASLLFVNVLLALTSFLITI